jgi:tetratricopeptide (TPR) repeat protein
MGDHAAAIEWFRSGLGAAAVTAESALALHYEIGVSYEALGEREKAIEHFSRVHRANPGYRDVTAALERLGKGGDNSPQPSSVNKGKVGYV